MRDNIFVIVVTYNGIKWIEKCLSSCNDYNTIVVDNNSQDGSDLFIQKHFPKVTILKQNENLGFGKANNIGISYALRCGAEAVFLLNQDAYLKENALERLIDISKNNKDYGVLSPIHLDWEGSLLEYYFAKFTWPCRGFFSAYMLNQGLKPIYDLQFIHAAAWFIPRQTFEIVGGFDPLFFHYGEDNNYCQRISFHNLKIGIVPNCYICHDSKLRVKPKNYSYSQEFYNEELKGFLVKYGDITIDYSKNIFFKVKLKLLALIVFQFLRLDIKKLKGRIKIYRMIIPYINKIKKSRKQNILKGPHYLKF